MDEPTHLPGTALSPIEQPRIPQRTPQPSRHNAATRHLCAGVYVDSAFRDRVLRDVYNDNKRHPAPSYGFDPIPVLRHAWRSWALDAAQHLVVTAVMVVLIGWRPLIALLVGSLVLVMWTSRQLHALMKAYWRDLFDFSGRRMSYGRDRASKFFGVVFALGLILFGGAAVILATGTHTGWLMRGNLIEALLVFLVPIGVAAVVASARQYALDRMCEEPKRETGTRLSSRLRTIRAHLTHGYTVYGGYRPFIGSGNRVRGWSFVQRLVPPEDLLAQLRPEGANVVAAEYTTPPCDGPAVGRSASSPSFRPRREPS